MNTDSPDLENPEPDGSPTQPGRRRVTWYDFLLGPPFKIIGFFYRSYRANRDRLTGLLSRPRVSSWLKIAMVVTLAVWIVVWLLASEESRTRLTDAVKENFVTLGKTFDE